MWMLRTESFFSAFQRPAIENLGCVVITFIFQDIPQVVYANQSEVMPVASFKKDTEVG